MRRLLVSTLAVAMFSSCMLTRVVDRSFVGITKKTPFYKDRLTTGVFLMPFTFVVDIATFPIQALLVVIMGDNFPFGDEAMDATRRVTLRERLESQPRYADLNDAQKATALEELTTLTGSQLDPNVAFALLPDGHWQVVPLSADARQQLIVRASHVPAPLAMCVR